jgi:hypothetical protein
LRTNGPLARGFAALLVLSPSLKAADLTPSDRAAVEGVIRQGVGSGKSPDGDPISENPDARHIVVGKGSGASASLLVAQYTIETGNVWQIYLAVIDRSTHRTLARGRVGGKGYREVALKAVADGVVDLDTLNYGADDPMCCPSVPGESSFEVRDGQLFERDARILKSASPKPHLP